MASFSAVVRDKLSQIVLKALTLDEARDVSPHFRRLRFSAPWLRTAACAPGDKLQIMINEVGPRTYTPFDHDAKSGTLDLVAYVHADTATGSWVRAARPGTSCRVFGPRGSLSLASLQGPIVFFGDETSFGTATSLQRARGAADGVSYVFEVSEPGEATEVLGQLGLRAPAVIARKPQHGHLAALEQAVRAAVQNQPNARLVLTGHAQSIQGLRKRLKVQPLQSSGQSVKAYWADGKRGLD
ncbi:MAG TPA: siderophore-interacting protein [Polyangiales bacterium]|nr:siderophore-interacting protein [Polyangiales bacterium]